MNNKLTLKKAEKLLLKDHPDFDEQWLRKVIEEDPSIIGLGDLELKEAERIQPKAGRLDLLLYDRENEKRYEVELMLGKVDESHIIRTIEYWDNERKRLPNYDHCAVIVAEDITTRFLNIIGLFNSQIPIIAIQLNALKVDEFVVLDFVKVLDEVTVGEDEDEGTVRKDRNYWDSKANKENLKAIDECCEIIKGIDTELTLGYTQNYIGLIKRNRPMNFVVFTPKQKFVRVGVRVSDFEKWNARLEKNDFEILTTGKRLKKTVFRLDKEDISKNRDLLKELFQEAYNERTS